MRPLIVILSAVLLAGAPRLVFGSGFSGSGSSGGSSGSGSGGSSGGSSSGGSTSKSSGKNNEASEPCKDSTTIVGRAECRRFGDRWDRIWQPRIRLGMGLTHTTRSMAAIDIEGSAGHDGEKHRYHYQPGVLTESSPPLHLLGGSVHIQFLVRHFHFGFEMGVAGTGVNGPWQSDEQGLTMRSTNTVQGKVGVVAGYGTRLGKWGLLGEVQTGMRMTSMNIESRLGASTAKDFTTIAEPIVEPRVAVQRWLSPWVSADLTLGSDLFQERDLSLTLNLTAHGRAFDGFF
jgi:hypothetical protein